MRRGLMLLLLLPIAAGCGAKQSGFEGSDQALKDIGTSRVEWTIEVTDPDWVYSSVGSIDYAQQRGELVMKGKDIPGGEGRALFIGRETYFGLDLQGKMRWQKDSYEAIGTDRFIPGPGGTDPNQLLGVLTKSSKEVEILGKEEIRGVLATHYRAHLDERKLEQTDRFSRNELVVDAWVDDNGLVRRVRAPYDQGVTVRVDLFDFGVPVEVDAPPADEIVSADDFWKAVDKWCTSRSPNEESQFCAVSAGTGVSEGEIQEGK
jgi:hypothetical protein